MIFRINNEFYRKLPKQICIFFLPKSIKNKTQNKAILELRNQLLNTLPNFSETEIRSLENIPFNDTIHIEIPLERYNELSDKIRKYNQKVKIFPIELGEVFEYKSIK